MKFNFLINGYFQRPELQTMLRGERSQERASSLECRSRFKLSKHCCQCYRLATAHRMSLSGEEMYSRVSYSQGKPYMKECGGECRAGIR